MSRLIRGAASRPRTIESVKENPLGRGNSTWVTSAHRAAGDDSPWSRDLQARQSFQRRFGDHPGALRREASARGLQRIFSKPFARPMSGFLETVAGGFREIYRRWAHRPQGPLLMGAAFLLTDGSYGFHHENVLDRSHPLKEGEPYHIEEGTLPYRRLPPQAAGGVFLVQGRAGVRLSLAEGHPEVWIHGKDGLRRMTGDELALLQAGDLFVLGERPTAMDRHGYFRDRSTVFRIDKEGGRWRVQELAHAEERLEDYQTQWLAQALGATEARARELLSDFHQEIARSGWTTEQKTAFVGREIIDRDYSAALAAWGFKGPLVHDCIAGLLRRFREKNWPPEESYRILSAILEGGRGFLPSGFDVASIFQGLEGLKNLGARSEEIAEWSARLMNGRIDFEEFFAAFPSALKALTGMGVERSEAASLLIAAFQATEALPYLPEHLPATVALVRAGFSPAETLSLLRVLVEFLGGESSESQTPSFDMTWDPSRSYLRYLDLAARVGRHLGAFGIPSSIRLRLIQEMIFAYREESDRALEEILNPKYSKVFADWKNTLGKVMEAVSSYPRQFLN